MIKALRRRFENEAVIQANLQHPHILQAIDILDGNELAIVMALVKGPTLEAHVLDEMKGALGPERVLAVMKPVLEQILAILMTAVAR